MILSDRAISHLDEDILGRKPFITSIVNFIEGQATDEGRSTEEVVKQSRRKISENLVIGIMGPWGSGKTSILNCIQSQLSNRFQTIYFNPWMHRSQEMILLDLFQAIAKVAGISGKDLKAELKKYAKFLGTLSKAAGAPEVAVDLFVELSEVDSGGNKSALISQKDKISQILSGMANPIVIFIDDLDRLDRQEIQFLFKVIKLTANFDNILYVIAFDKEIVAESIKGEYGGGKIEDGYAFLEKIIQIPLKVPEASKDALMDFTFKRSSSLFLSKPNNEFEKRLRKDIQLFFHARPFTIRDIKRALNSFSFTVQTLGEQIDNCDLFLIELIRVLHPGLFSVIQFFYLYFDKNGLHTDPIYTFHQIDHTQLFGLYEQQVENLGIYGDTLSLGTPKFKEHNQLIFRLTGIQVTKTKEWPKGREQAKLFEKGRLQSMENLKLYMEFSIHQTA